ncbi:MAG TPA: hypothetical protein VI461_01595, partial [Chitinophagaceae bacterium]|nr:hypothetical protein [Chitinophagaceae bacterium]
DGKLDNSRGGTLIPIAENIFSLGQNRIEIQTSNRRILLISPVDTSYFIAVDSANTDKKSLNEYAGEYWSDETESKFAVIVKDGKLIAHRHPKTDYTLTPMYKDGFSSPGNYIYFERDKRNRVTNMKIFTGRARNVEFKKIMQ